MPKLITVILILFTKVSVSQTTFYLEASGAQFGLPAPTVTWTTTTSALASSASPTGFKTSSTIATTTLAVDASSSTATTMFGQFISPALKAQTISGTVTGYARMAVANTTGATCQSRIKIMVINRAGTVVATLLAMTSGASNLTTTLTSYQIANAATLTSYTCADGDRICIEIGIGRSAGTTARTGDVSFGSSSATDITAAGSTTANNPVVTFSGTLSFLKGTIQ